MDIAKIYLHSLIQDVSSCGLLDHQPAVPEVYRTLLGFAADLTGYWDKKSDLKSATSIFSVLPIKDKVAETRRYPLKRMELLESFFPSEKGQGDLMGLKNGFNSAYQSLEGLDDRVKAETLLHLLHTYGAALSCSEVEGVSLYDAAKTKAAIATCLAAFDLGNLPSQPFLMIGGDTSGIQNFIFSIVSKNAAKNLKGRSYYLHLLVDTVLQRLLADLGLFQCNVVYASGGSFYVLAPNTPKILSAVETLEAEISEKIFAAHKFDLALHLSTVAFGQDVFVQNGINSIWTQLHEGFADKKSDRMGALLQSKFGKLFEPHEVGGLQRRDAITQEEILDEHLKENLVYKLGEAVPQMASKADYGDDDTDLIHKSTQEQIILGFFMKSEMYRLSGKEALLLSFKDRFQQDRKIMPLRIDVAHYILNEHGHIPSDTTHLNQILVVNNPDFLYKLSSKTVRGFEFYGGNQYPTIKLKKEGGVPKTFSEMAGMAEEEREQDYAETFQELPFKRLGVLRMDVDGLGSIFRNYKGSLAHFSALSRHLDWFFKGYLNTIWETGSIEKKDANQKTLRYNFKDWTQIIYSGGDDLFIVGKWDCLIDFAQKIQEKFKQWTCEHPNMGISGGLVFVTHKFPITKAAELCDDAEKAAKHHEFKPTQKALWKKNTITFFDHPLHWEHEFPVVVGLKEELYKLTLEGHLPRGLLIALQTFHAQKKEQEREGLSPTWRWQIAYQIARLKLRTNSKEAWELTTDLDENIRHTQTNKALKFLSQLATNIFLNRFDGKALSSKYDFFDLVAIAARWVEYELRSLSNENQDNANQNTH